jgi:hypothetical protein
MTRSVVPSAPKQWTFNVTEDRRKLNEDRRKLKLVSNTPNQTPRRNPVDKTLTLRSDSIRPYIDSWTADGPVLILGDGRVQLLTFREKLMVTFGLTNAAKLDQKYSPLKQHLG